MIELHYSNRLENLIEPLAAAIKRQQRGAPLEPVSIIVPNRVVEQFVRYRLAETIGIAANLRFPFLRSYFARQLESIDRRLKILDADNLQIVLFECIRGERHRNDAELGLVRDYVEAGSKSASDIELRTLLLAGHVAHLFREYSISRRAMLQRWSAARANSAAAMTGTERWQRHLWRCVFGADGAVLPEWVADPSRRWMMLPDAIDALDAAERRSAFSGELHVFGQSYMGTAFAEIFSTLGKQDGFSIHIYACNPCFEFWEDVAGANLVAGAKLVRRGDRIGKLREDAEDPFELASGDTPALRLWARPGREHIRLLNELTDCDFTAHFSDPTNEHSATLLCTLQNDILTRAPERSLVEDGHGAQIDATVRFLACPGIRREVEIVANEIQSLLSADDRRLAGGGAGPLRLHEIAIVAPDGSFEQYLPHLESVLREHHQIPVDVVNRRFANISRVAEAIELLVRLPLGRFGRDEMIRLLTHPAMIGDADDVEAWRVWIEQLGVFFGADGDDLRDTYIRDDLFNWDQALKRLALGTLMAGEVSGFDETFDSAAGDHYLPLEIPQDSIESVARLVSTARSLIADALKIRAAQLTLPEWSRVLGELVARYIRAETSIDERVRDSFLEEIEDLAADSLRSEQVGFETAQQLVASRIEELESRGGKLAATGVAVGSTSALRSIPFKVIFALGLGEGEFPARSAADQLDLRSQRRQAGDVSSTERDRYLFLEALLAARDAIYLSYVARDGRTGDPLEPSVLIRELQFILRGYLDEAALRALTIEHRVSRYSLDYFPTLPGATDAEKNARLESFDADARRGARMIALRRNLGKHLGARDLPLPSRPLALMPAEARKRIRESLKFVEASADTTSVEPERDEIWLPILALKQYLECPLQASARYALGMLREDIDDQEDAQEPLEQSALQRAVLMREVFWECGGDKKAIAEKFEEALLIAQMKGEAPAGMFGETVARDGEELIKGWIDLARKEGVSDLAEWQDIRIGRADEFLTATKTLDAISLDVTIKRPDGVAISKRVKLHGAVRRFSPRLDASIQGVVRKTIEAKHFLPLFINAIALSAAGESIARNFRAIVLGDGRAQAKEWSPPKPSDARTYLARLAGSLLSDGNSYFLPFEAIEKFWKDGDKAGVDIEADLEEMRLNSNSRCFSDYGPVRNARDLDLPDLKAIRSIIAERYELIGAIFEKAKTRK
ncbi:MAG: exodeoxyribonuclease V subunit gamma [Candidatus Binatus sp.]|uniref:exodeoxyribonuclease V subunit gamma n=1 Tax=Candidatus Binatus sp. TaxID=2811406 RepID=UPI00271BB572|nr:exodeoxyribonuclease V subunit gamma [Candidatus Binatus sp.]MDO8431519.1 exodeoxyribonuclease V subunit gamma [Candidatus Binatus sp.]